MSSTTMAAHAVTSPLFAVFPGVGTTPPSLSTPDDAFPAPLLPKPWQHALVVLVAGDPEYGQRVAKYGTVTYACAEFFNVLLEGRTEETTVNQTGQAQWSTQDKSGTLPLWFLTQKAARNTSENSCRLEARAYDLILSDESRVYGCFFVGDFFLDTAGQSRRIALADVARLRPSL